MPLFSELFGGATPKWVTGTTYAVDRRVWSPVNFHTYRRKSAGAGSTDPSADPTNWALEGASKIKSIQRGTIALSTGQTSNTATISSVNWSYAVLTKNGSRTSSGDTASLPYVTDVNLEETNSTTITARRGDADPQTALVVGYTVVEYWPS